MREGKLERAIREHLGAHPDEAFSTDELAEHCYPDTRTIERKHRVSVLRAARKVVSADPDWAWRVSESHGGSLVFFNRASVPSRAMAHHMAEMAVAYHSPKRRERIRWARSDFIMTDVLERPDVIAKVQDELSKPHLAHVTESRQQAVAWHKRERDGDTEEKERVAFERMKHRVARDIQLTMLVLDQKRMRVMRAAAKEGIVLPPNFDQPAPVADLTALAEKARALIVQNDPDAVRQGLNEIANALDCIALDWDPLGPLRKVLQQQQQS
jgi:hypothetical protein